MPSLVVSYPRLTLKLVHKIATNIKLQPNVATDNRSLQPTNKLALYPPQLKPY